MYRIVTCLFLAFLVTSGKAEDDFLSGLSDSIKEDLFAIYTGAALATREVVGTEVTPDKVTYYLYTKNNPEIDQFIKIDPENPEELNKDVPIVFIIHGWVESRRRQWYEDLKNAFLAKDEKYQVVQVDWSPLSFQEYMVASYTTKDVGNIIGGFIVDLHEKYSIPLGNFLVVGHSLGGQIAGFIGKKVQELTSDKLPRIVALDPAGPLFMSRPVEERLNENDAEVVQVIHTSGGTLGYLDSCGTIDFFLNGGSTQPGCIDISLTDPKSLVEPVMCNHFRSWMYFIEALNKPEEFKGIKCKNWLTYVTGYLCDNEYLALGDLETKTSGSFYLPTNNQEPYSEVKKGLFS